MWVYWLTKEIELAFCVLWSKRKVSKYIPPLKVLWWNPRLTFIFPLFIGATKWGKKKVSPFQSLFLFHFFFPFFFCYSKPCVKKMSLLMLRFLKVFGCLYFFSYLIDFSTFNSKHSRLNLSFFNEKKSH